MRAWRRAGQVSRHQEISATEAISALLRDRGEGRAVSRGRGTTTASTTSATPIDASTRTSNARLRTTSRPTRRAGSTAAPGREAAPMRRAAGSRGGTGRSATAQPDQAAAEHEQQRPLPADPAATDRRAVVDGRGVALTRRCRVRRPARSAPRRRWAAASRGSSARRRRASARRAGHLAHLGRDVTDQPAVGAGDADVDDGRPGRTMSAVTSPGTPAAATMTSARRRWPARSRVPVWHRVTVAFSVRRVSSRPSGRPTVTPRPTTHDLGAGQLDVVAPQQLDDAARRARQRRRPPSTSRPRLVGCSPSASLAGSIRSSTRWRPARRAAAAARCSRCRPGRR